MRTSLSARLSAPGGPVLRGVCLSVCLISAATASLAVAVLGSLEASNRVPETSVLEGPQPWIWVAVGLTAGLASFRPNRRRDLWFALWIGAASCLAALRELDLHVLLNPENIEVLGLRPEQAMRYRLDWWTDGSVPGSLKLAWGALLAIVGMVLFIPLLLARVRWRRLLLGFDGFAWCVALGVVMLFAGMVADDLLRATGIGGTLALQTVEEALELCGSICILVAVGLLVRTGHHARTSLLRADEQSQPSSRDGAVPV